ncbi:MAG: hypothetical protein AB8E15_01165 [Bdellovibrionales bacterium]
MNKNIYLLIAIISTFAGLCLYIKRKYLRRPEVFDPVAESMGLDIANKK